MISSDFTAMKPGDYDEHSRNLPLFPTFQRQQPPQHQHQRQQQQALFHQISLAQKRECKSDDVEVNSRGVGGEPSPMRVLPSPSDTKRQKKAGDGGDEDSIEVARRPRGRPPGSKNKPKPPVAAAPSDTSPTQGMCSHILEFPAGHDITDSLARFSRRRDVGLSVLSATGPVLNVTFRQQAASGVSTMTFHGRFELLSISASFLPSSFATSYGIASPSGPVSISVAGPQGQIIGGLISGPLVAAGTVIIVAATFSSPSFHRLPMESDQSATVSGEGGRSGDAEAHQQLHLPGGAGGATAGDASGGMSIYGGHLSSDIMWAPTARGPPPF